MNERYNIVNKKGKKYLVEGFVDHGALCETWSGNLKTQNIFGPNFVLEDQHRIIFPGSEYKVKKSGGEEGIMKKSLFGDYEYQKKEKPDKDENCCNYGRGSAYSEGFSNAPSATGFGTILFIFICIGIGILIKSILTDGSNNQNNYPAPEPTSVSEPLYNIQPTMEEVRELQDAAWYRLDKFQKEAELRGQKPVEEVRDFQDKAEKKFQTFKADAELRIQKPLEEFREFQDEAWGKLEKFQGKAELRGQELLDGRSELRYSSG